MNGNAELRLGGFVGGSHVIGQIENKAIDENKVKEPHRRIKYVDPV